MQAGRSRLIQAARSTRGAAGEPSFRACLHRADVAETLTAAAVRAGR